MRSFDLSLQGPNTSHKAGPYFVSSLFGYACGLGLTFFVNEMTHHGQPALFYIDPLIISSVLATAVFRNELPVLFAFEENQGTNPNPSSEPLSDVKDS
jgi:minor histocompatibility antigen H13